MHVRNNEKGCKVIKNLLEFHSQKLFEMQKGTTNALGSTFEK
jgi:hypothetical protein